VFAKVINSGDVGSRFPSPKLVSFSAPQTCLAFGHRFARWARKLRPDFGTRAAAILTQTWRR